MLRRRRLREVEMRRLLRVMGVVMLAGGVGVAQVGPPGCPVGGAKTAAGGGRSATARPSVAAVQAIAEAGAAGPSVLVAGAPVGNFGLARYRLEDYGECAGTGGC